MNKTGALILAAIAWPILFISFVYAVGDPRPGAGYAAAIEHKNLIFRVTFLSGAALLLLSLGLSIKNFRQHRKTSIAALVINLLWPIMAIIFTLPLMEHFPYPANGTTTKPAEALRTANEHNSKQR